MRSAPQLLSLCLIFACGDKDDDPQGPDTGEGDTDTDDTDTDEPDDDTGGDDGGEDDTGGGEDDTGSGCEEALLYADADGDGFGDPATEELRCPEEGWVEDGCDCDDTDTEATGGPFDCPLLECPEDGGIWMRGECGAITELTHGGSYELTEDAALTMCPGIHPLQLTVATDRVAIKGTTEDPEDTLWGARPALTVSQEGATVEVAALTLYGSTYSGSGEEGILVDARAGGVDLQMDGVIFGKTTAEVASMSVVEIDGNLTMTDSRLMRLKSHFGLSYSNSCSQVGVRVTGDVELVRTEVTEMSMGCSSWTHSSWNSATTVALDVGGNLTLEDVSIIDNSVMSASSGVGAEGYLSLIQVEGDLSATNVEATGNTVATDVYCTRSSCSRTFEGGLLRVHGSLSWTTGTLDANTVGVQGDMVATGSWQDSGTGAPIYWLPYTGDTLDLVDVDLGSDAAPDIAGSVEYDGDGLTTVACTDTSCG